MPVPFRAGAPGVIDLAELRKRLAKKAPPVPAGPDPTLAPNEFALQMLRFPYRQVFGDPDNKQGSKFFGLDTFKPTVSLTTWKAAVKTDLGL